MKIARQAENFIFSFKKIVLCRWIFTESCGGSSSYAKTPSAVYAAIKRNLLNLGWYRSQYSVWRRNHITAKNTITETERETSLLFFSFVGISEEFDFLFLSRLAREGWYLCGNSVTSETFD